MKLKYLHRLWSCSINLGLFLVCLQGSAVWGQSWLTGRCSRAPASALVCRLWACGRCCWRKEFSTRVRLCGGALACARLCWKPLCWRYRCDTVGQELSFQDKYLFYRFLDDEQEGALFPSEEERRESQEELQDTLLLLSQIGPDAHMRMILRKRYESRCLTSVILQLEGCHDPHVYVFQPIWKNSRWSGDNLWRTAAYKGFITSVQHCE